MVKQQKHLNCSRGSHTVCMYALAQFLPNIKLLENRFQFCMLPLIPKTFPYCSLIPTNMY